MFKYLLILCLLPATLFAQNISYSSTFPEPEEGQNKLYIMQDGRTVWANIHNNLQLKVYDKQRTLAAEKMILHKAKMGGGKMEYSIADIFEKNGKLLIFINKATAGSFGTIGSSIRSLYRITYDPATNEVAAIDELAKAEQIKSVGYDMGDMVSNDIYLVNDPVSDQYAVLLFNGYVKDGKDRQKAYVYNGNNELVKEAVIVTPVDDKKFIHHAGISMYDKVLYTGCNEDDAKIRKSYAIPYYVSKLGADATTFETKKVMIAPYHINSKTRMAYNPSGEQLQVLSCTNKGKKEGIVSNLTIINPADLSVVSSKPVPNASLAAYSRTTLGDKKGFDMGAATMTVFQDGTVLVSPVETYEKQYRTGNNTYTKTFVSKLGQLTYDSKGDIVSTTAVSVRPNEQVSMAAYEYYTIKTIRMGDSYYLIMNDLDENIEKGPAERQHGVSSISDCHTALCKVNGNKIERSYLFGAPASKRESVFSMVGTSEYDEASKTYVTIAVERNDRNKKAKLAWVEF